MLQFHRGCMKKPNHRERSQAESFGQCAPKVALGTLKAHGRHGQGEMLFFRRYEPDQVLGFGQAISAHTMWTPRSGNTVYRLHIELIADPCITRRQVQINSFFIADATLATDKKISEVTTA